MKSIILFLSIGVIAISCNLPSSAKPGSKSQDAQSCLKLVRDSVGIKGRYEVRSIYRYTGKTLEIGWGASYLIDPDARIADLKKQLSTSQDIDYSIRNAIGSISTMRALNAGIEEVKGGAATCVVHNTGSKPVIKLLGAPEIYKGYVYQTASPVKGTVINYDPKCPFKGDPRCQLECCK